MIKWTWTGAIKGSRRDMKLDDVKGNVTFPLIEACSFLRM